MKALKDFFTDVTDIDNKLIRTLVMLFRSPDTVVRARLAREDTYVKPLRYVILMTTFSLVVSFVFEYFFMTVEQEKEWLVPVRVTELNERYGDFYNNFFPFIVLVTILPLSIVLMKLLFFRKSWREISIIMLYGFGQFWVLMLLFVWIPVETELWQIVIQLVLFSSVFFLFRKLFTGFWVPLLKWVSMTIVMLLWFNYVCVHLVVYTYVLAVGKTNMPEIIRPHESNPEVETWPKEDKSRYDYTRHDPENTILYRSELDTGWRITCLSPQRDTLWRYTLKGTGTPRVFRVRLPTGTLGWLITEDNGKITGPKANLLNERGEVIFTHTYANGFVLNCGTINDHTLLLAGGKDSGGVIVPFIDALTFTLADSKFVVTSERSYTLPNERQRFYDLFSVKSGAAGIEVIASKYEVSAAGILLTKIAEISNLSLMRLTLDTVLRTQWETVVYNKITHYSPGILEFRTKLDTLNQRITSSYPLPNDSLITTQLFQLDLTGKLLWRKDIRENDYTRTFDFVSDATGVYYCGATGNGLPRHPIVRFYRLALLGYISPDGKIESSLRYGRFLNNEWYSFNKIIPGDTTITVFGFHESEGILNSTMLQQELIFSKRELRVK